MSKQVFWPTALVVMGLLFLSANLGAVPQEFWNLWPLLFIIVGLGGLLTADRKEWLYEKKAPAKKQTGAKKSRSKSKK